MVGSTVGELEDLSLELRDKIWLLRESSSFSILDFALPEELALFVSWLMVDLTGQEDSAVFNARLAVTLSELASELEIDPDHHRLHMVGWIIGRPHNRTGKLFPTELPRLIGSSSFEAQLAFEGLLRHTEFLVDEGGTTREPLEAEMLMTSILVRLLGLAEAVIRPNAERDKEKDATFRVLKDALIQSQKVMSQSVKRAWVEDSALRLLVNRRHAVAHIWKRDTRPSLSEIMKDLDESYIDSMMEFATCMVAANLTESLKQVNQSRAQVWLDAVSRNIKQLF